jgi:hypothetical protein
LHVQTSKLVQFPFDEHTVGSDEFLLKQVKNSQIFPEYPSEQLQVSRPKHPPRPEQTLMFVAEIPPQVRTETPIIEKARPA